MRQFTRYSNSTEDERGDTLRFGRYSTQPSLPMRNNLESGSEDTERKPFATIDDALEKVQELSGILSTLAERKRPLDVRRGVEKDTRRRMGLRGYTSSQQREEVSDVRDNRVDSKQVNGAGRTYFFDVQKSSKGDLYLTITESHKQDGKFQRNKIIVFPEDAEAFVTAGRRARLRRTGEHRFGREGLRARRELLRVLAGAAAVGRHALGPARAVARPSPGRRVELRGVHRTAGADRKST